MIWLQASGFGAGRWTIMSGVRLLSNTKHIEKQGHLIGHTTPPVRLLDKVRQRIRLKGYSIRTERFYSQWIKQFILFHNKRHPRDMGKMEIEAFLSDLAMYRNVAASAQNRGIIEGIIGAAMILSYSLRMNA